MQGQNKEREREREREFIFLSSHIFCCNGFFYAKKGVLAKKGDYIAYNHVLQPKDGNLVTHLGFMNHNMFSMHGALVGEQKIKGLLYCHQNLC